MECLGHSRQIASIIMECRDTARCQTCPNTLEIGKHICRNVTAINKCKRQEICRDVDRGGVSGDHSEIGAPACDFVEQLALVPVSDQVGVELAHGPALDRRGGVEVRVKHVYCDDALASGVAREPAAQLCGPPAEEGADLEDIAVQAIELLILNLFEQ